MANIRGHKLVHPGRPAMFPEHGHHYADEPLGGVALLRSLDDVWTGCMTYPNALSVGLEAHGGQNTPLRVFESGLILEGLPREGGDATP